MALNRFTKTNWLKRIVEFPNRFKMQTGSNNSITLTEDPGTITQQGTAVTADRLNNLENQVEAITNEIIDVDKPKVNSLTTRVQTTEGQITTLSQSVSTNRSNITGLQSRMSTVESLSIANNTDINAVEVSIGDINKIIKELQVSMGYYDVSASLPDANGIYTLVTYRYPTNSNAAIFNPENKKVFMDSTLSNKDVYGNYLTDTWRFFTGVESGNTRTMILQVIWTLTYDTNGSITSKSVTKATRWANGTTITV